MQLAEPTPALPIDSEWEDVNMALVVEIMAKFNVTVRKYFLVLRVDYVAVVMLLSLCCCAR
jgi:hypothetical protein